MRSPESVGMTRFAVLALLAVGACGYRVAGTETSVPSGAHTVSVRFQNHTREHGLGVHLRRALEDEIRRHGALTVVEEGGDLVLDCDVRRLTTVPVAFSANDEAVQYQGVMQVRFRLIE